MLLNVELCQLNHKHVSNIPPMACPKYQNWSQKVWKGYFKCFPSYVKDLMTCTCMRDLVIQFVSRRHLENPRELAYKLREVLSVYMTGAQYISLNWRFIHCIFLDQEISYIFFSKVLKNMQNFLGLHILSDKDLHVNEEHKRAWRDINKQTYQFH